MSASQEGRGKYQGNLLLVAKNFPGQNKEYVKNSLMEESPLLLAVQCEHTVHCLLFNNHTKAKNGQAKAHGTCSLIQCEDSGGIWVEDDLCA